jgi:hypothetical protein
MSSNSPARTCVFSIIVAAAMATTACGQYPSVPTDQAAAQKSRREVSDRLSEEALDRAMPIILAEAEAGRPYIPWASHPFDLPRAAIPAFPGAWGGGMYTAGGRGGKVFVVTSLEDSGPGTLREALEAGGARTIVFNVSGIIRLKDRIRIRAPYVTLNGATAPGDGVCVAGNTVEIETHDVLIRHMRFRRGATEVADRNDSIGGNPVGNIMIDQVSASWGLDENISMYRHMYPLRDDSADLQHPIVRSKYRTAWTPNNTNTDVKLPTANITIQNSISSEALDTYNHAFGSTIGGRNSTFHRNLWACNTGRNPSVGMDGDFTFVNNVLFNWRHRTIDGGDHLSNYNIINNYFKPGPTTPDKPIAYRLLKPESRRSKVIKNDFGKAYVAGNIVEGHDTITADNWSGGVQLSDSGDPAIEGAPDYLAMIRAERPFSFAPLPVVTAKDAFDEVLAKSGATRPRRDAVDQRVTEMVRTGVVSHPQGNGIITDVNQVGGYPEYKGTPRLDADTDGMPDEWETANGLNPADATDAVADPNADGYTNIEAFMYGLDPRGPRVNWADLRNNVDPLR